MIKSNPPDASELLQRATVGDEQAIQELLGLHRKRLKRMVEVRLDRRLSARIDPSDIVQETLADAVKKLPKYLELRPLPFFPWLRQLAWERVMRSHRQHLYAKARSVAREEPYLPDHSAFELAKRLLASGSSPSEQLTRKETRAKVQTALARLSPEDREVLVLRFLENLSTCEAAEVLGVSEQCAKSRQRRAIERFGLLVEDLRTGESQ